MTTPESPDLVALAERLETENGEGLYVLCHEAAAALRECAAEQDSAKKRQLAQLIELKADTEMPLMGIVNNLKAENQSLRDQLAAYEPVILRIKQLQYAGIGDEPLVIVDTKRGPVPAALAALPEKDDG